MNNTDTDVSLVQTRATIVVYVVSTIFTLIIICLACSCCYSSASSVWLDEDEVAPAWSTEVRNKNRKIRRKTSNQKSKAFKTSLQFKNHDKRKKSIFVV